MLFQQPNHTKVPNQFLDEMMRELKGADVKIFLAICRKTMGWHKETDYISISQMQEITGLSNRAVIDAVNRLAEMKAITKEKTRGATRYTLGYEENSQAEIKQSEESSQDKVKKVHSRSEESSHTKETHLKKLNKRNSYIVLSYLNEKAKRSYKAEAHLKLIEARLKKFSVEDLKLIVDKKVSQWGEDEKMSKYLQPSTLFRSDARVDEYLNEPVKLRFSNNNQVPRDDYTPPPPQILFTEGIEA